MPLFLDTTHYAYIQTRALDIRNFRLRARFLPKFLTKLLHYSEGENRVKTFLQSLLIPNVRTFYDPEHGYDARVETLNGFSVLDACGNRSVTLPICVRNYWMNCDRAAPCRQR